MYELVSAIAKPVGGDGRWQAVDIGSVAMATLYSSYERVLATLTNPFLVDLVSLNLDDVRAQAAGLTKTFNQFLIDNADNTLPTSTTLLQLAAKWARYRDATAAGYKATPIHPTAAIGTPYPAADLTNLQLTRPHTDYTLFVNNCMVAVNGFFHPIDGSTAGVVVKQGNQSALLSGLNNLGVLSFQDLGSLTQVPITAAMIKKESGIQPLANRAYVDLGQDVSENAVLLVLGGYLHVLDPGVFWRMSGSVFAIDFNNLPLLQRYYESRKYLDLTSLGLSTTSRNESQVAVSELYGDTALMAYLTLPQSFFVVLSKKHIFVDRQVVRKTHMPDMYISDVEPIWPLQVGSGKLANFWQSYEDGQWSLNCADTLRQNRAFTQTGALNLNSVSAQRIPSDSVSLSKPQFLKIGTQLQTYTQTRADWLANQPI